MINYDIKEYSYRKVKWQNRLQLLLYWYRMLSGKSYFHIPQTLGKAFQPNVLTGYFNDLTGKTKWKGLLDHEGIPINQFGNGSTSYFPTTITQKGLGHYDQYILTGDCKEFDEFIKICNWLIKIQDKEGGWKLELMNLISSNYSAMTQGEAVSALVRAWKHTGGDQYIKATTKAYILMTKPVENGGTAYYRSDDIYLEETPLSEKNTILNGWIFALFGVYDFCLATGNTFNIFYQSFNTLKRNLFMFDSGYWSFYDEERTLASPFYHDLHISQLEALLLVTGDETINHYINKWKSYRRNLIKRYYAFGLKAYQKLRCPARIIIIE